MTCGECGSKMVFVGLGCPGGKRVYVCATCEKVKVEGHPPVQPALKQKAVSV